MYVELGDVKACYFLPFPFFSLCFVVCFFWFCFFLIIKALWVIYVKVPTGVLSAVEKNWKKLCNALQTCSIGIALEIASQCNCWRAVLIWYFLSSISPKYNIATSRSNLSY